MGKTFETIMGTTPVYALAKLIVGKITEDSADTTNDKDLASVRAETERQENEMQRLEAKAKVAQEMAIAARIESATEVKIEEYYEYGGNGKAGLDIAKEAATLGLSGGGKRVTKRVVIFTGHNKDE